MKKYTHIQKLHFAKTLGYDGIADAYGDLGINGFLELFWQQKDVPILMNGSKVLLRKQMTDINPAYFIYENGKVYSTHFGGRFLKQSKYQSKDTHTPHYAYPITYNGKRRRFFINRLLFWYFKYHNYKHIDDIPPLLVGESLAEIKVAKKGEIQRKANKDKDLHAKIKDTKPNIFAIAKLIKRNVSNRRIAEIYNVSDMSIHRFLKRNKKEIYQWL